MKKFLIILGLIVFFANNCNAAPNYSFSQSKNGVIKDSHSNLNVYNPSIYIQNQIVNNPQYDVVEIVIDYSGSMRPWIDRAKAVMRQILPQIPQSTHVGLRVFGQKTNTKILKSNNLFANIAHNMSGVVGSVANTCQSTSQLVSVSPINTTALISAMNNTYIGSSTPLTLALEQTVYNDFKNKKSLNKKKIILITDGGESCGRNPCAFIKNLIKTKNDIQIDVIMINGSNNLMCLSEATGGKFYNVTSVYNFDSALGSSLKKQPDISSEKKQNEYIQNTGKTTSNYQFIKE